jgi:hypothetical protein
MRVPCMPFMPSTPTMHEHMHGDADPEQCDQHCSPSENVGAMFVGKK